MAIAKSVTETNGITLTYHRVVRIDTMVNSSTLVEVGSYLDRDARERQIESEEAQSRGEPGAGQQYVVTTFHQLPYSDGMTAADAYLALKSLPEFSGAEDVWEEGQVVSDAV